MSVPASGKRPCLVCSRPTSWVRVRGRKSRYTRTSDWRYHEGSKWWAATFAPICREHEDVWVNESGLPMNWSVAS